MDGNFLCLVRAEPGGSSSQASPPAAADTLVLPKDALSARQLAKAAEGEPQAVEVYQDDPRSWAHELTRVPEGDERRSEGSLLQALNARLLVPLVTKNRLLGFVLLGEKRSEEPYSREDKELLLAASQQAAIALDYAQLIESTAEQAVLKRDLELATEVQQNLLPTVSPPVPGLDYAGICKPARGVGGDYFDFLQLEGGKLGLALGDISGKGVGAAILMASLQAMLRSQAPLRGEAVDALASGMNRLMAASTDGSKFSTFFYGVYDPESGLLTYVNAGHNPPVLLRAAGGEAERLTATGMLLGMFPEAPYKRGQVRLEPGDLLVVFSDGVSEAFNEAGEEFGEERLVALLNERRGESARSLCASVVDAVNQFAGAALQSDDVTLVVARVLGTP
jgi:sigma-B regulation protein RsbU (phosphoserine phosphatase)